MASTEPRYTTRRSVALDAETAQALKAEAMRQSTQVATIVRQAIRVYLANVRQATERRAS